VFEMITDAVVMTINALDKPEENIVKGWAHHIYGTELAKNPLALKYWLIFSTAG